MTTIYFVTPMPTLPNNHPAQTSANSSSSTDIDNTTTDNSSTANLAMNSNANDETSLLLNELLIDEAIRWQVYNCKISEKQVSQTQPMPFLYHYDTLSDELKDTHPLTPDLLARFNDPMLPAEANALLGLPEHTIMAPWQVKIVGTLVLFCEPIQLALRLKFTNTAKDAQPIYTQEAHTALIQASKNWHLCGDVFVLNKNSKPVSILVNDTLSNIERSSDYQCLTRPQALVVQAEIEAQPTLKLMLQHAI